MRYLVDKESQNKQIRNIQLELIFDYFITGEMELFHCFIETTIKRMQRKYKADESFDAYIRGLEKDFDEYLQTWTEVFKEYREKATIKHVENRIPKNEWIRLKKQLLSDPEVQAHAKKSLSDRKQVEFVQQQLSRDVKRRQKKLDIV